jgi:hypothetical protein
MPHGYQDRNTKHMKHYTGLPHERAGNHLKVLGPGLRRIPDATGPQEHLEALILEHLRGDVDYFAHPLGIASVTPRPDSITVTLDASTTRHDRLLAAHALEGLLPAEVPTELRTEGETPVIGVPGLRVAQASRSALHLTLAKTTASLILTSDNSIDWSDLLATRESDLAADGYTPCWSEANFTDAERTFHRDHADLCQAVKEAAWLPSGLLRRVGLFHEVSTAFCTRYWVAGFDLWRFELKHEHGVPAPHEEFLAHLTDPKWGISLRVGRVHCVCDAPGIDPQYDRQCTARLSSTGTREGTLQLRFTTMRNRCDYSDVYHDLVRADAPQEWIRRVMPRHHKASTTLGPPP